MNDGEIGKKKKKATLKRYWKGMRPFSGLILDIWCL
jgi:hypothetical protein